MPSSMGNQARPRIRKAGRRRRLRSALYAGAEKIAEPEDVLRPVGFFVDPVLRRTWADMPRDRLPN